MQAISRRATCVPAEALQPLLGAALVPPAALAEVQRRHDAAVRSTERIKAVLADTSLQGLLDLPIGASVTAVEGASADLRAFTSQGRTLINRYCPRTQTYTL